MVWLEDIIDRRSSTKFGVYLHKCDDFGFMHRGLDRMFGRDGQPEGMYVKFYYVGINKFINYHILCW
jgi:hypothetical protein